MRFLDHTFPSPAENLTFDTWLLQEAVRGNLEDDLLWLWESPCVMVVLGRGSKWREEVAPCLSLSEPAPVFRRTSGGAAIVCGPGCLMYSLILAHDRHAPARSISTTHEYVLDRMVTAFRRQAWEVSRAGTSDLVILQNGMTRKFSGNSMRRTSHWVLYHGTFLYNFPLAMISAWLAHPPREPDYRHGRAHGEFVANVPLERAALVEIVSSAWKPLEPWPLPESSGWQGLVQDQFGNSQWNQRL